MQLQKQPHLDFSFFKNTQRVGIQALTMAILVIEMKILDSTGTKFDNKILY